jgi:hypothetical protein
MNSADGNLAEVVFYHALENDDVLNAQALAQRLDDAREPIRTGRLDHFYDKDLVPLQPYGGVGEENIPLRYRNFTERVGTGIKEASEHPDGFGGVFYPLSGVDLSTVTPLLKDKGVLITLDSTDPFARGYRPERDKANDVDRMEMQRDAFEKATHGMHSIEMTRGAWGVSSDLQLAGFNPERGDQFRVIEQQEGERIQEGMISPTRKRTKTEITIGGKKILWIHYQMNLGLDTLSEQEPNQEGIWKQLRTDLGILFSEEDSLLVSKAGMFESVGTVAMARSGLLCPGNYVCMDRCNDQNKQLPGLSVTRVSLEQLADISPQFDEHYRESHKMVYPYIQFGYQDDPKNIFLARVEKG